MLCERGRDTEAKVKWPKRRIHVSPEIIHCARKGPSKSKSAPKLQPQAGECWNLTFFPEVKELLVFTQHTNTQCVRGKVLSGECLEQRFQYLWVLRVSACMCVCFCATSCRLHTNSASGSCRKFFTCFLIEPHLAQAQTHIWTHRLEKISKPATHRDCGSQRNF